jgi:hypothetical protein
MSVDLEQLLREADAGARPPAERVSADLAGSIRSLARRRRSIRMTGGASAAIAGMVVLSFVLYPSQPDQRIVTTVAPQSPADAESLARAMAAVSAEADARMRMVERVVAAGRRTDANRGGRAADPLIAVRREQDRAAFLLIYEADRLARQSSESARAAEEYRRVVTLFPDTRWASVARERLAELGGASHRLGTDAIGTPGTTKDLS